MANVSLSVTSAIIISRCCKLKEVREERMTQKAETRNLRINSITPLDPPAKYWDRYPPSTLIDSQIASHRKSMEEIISGVDDRMLMIVGPCSIHDTKAGLEYALKLRELANKVEDKIFIAMRVYFEKPRTTLGWKGFINDPSLNGKEDVSRGLLEARKFLMEVCELGLPTATEWLEPFTPQYLGDLVSWGAIGARTTESQPHRLIASGLSMPIGFKNGTGGSIQIAVDAILAARSKHVFLGIDDNGLASIVKTNGNMSGHLVLRGGKDGPNYNAESVSIAVQMLKDNDLYPSLIVDCSHANSNKDHTRQPLVFKDVIGQRIEGNKNIVGVMVESHLKAGKQDLGDDPSNLEYGMSITDACVDWSQTEDLINYSYQKLK